MAVVRSTRSTESPVPDKEEVPPNQCGSMWAETAKQMGATQGQKQSQDSTEAPEPPATARIGNLNRKQARIKFTDLYSGGVSSGRAAAPDAWSAAQNAETCMGVAVAAIALPPTAGPAIPAPRPLPPYAYPPWPYYYFPTR